MSTSGQTVFYLLQKTKINRDTEMKSDAVFKRAFNDAADFVSGLRAGDSLPTETVLSSKLGVSRTTVRKVLIELTSRGVVAGSGTHRTVRRHVSAKRFPEKETVSAAAQVERRFMEWMLRDDSRPGTVINTLELGRQFGVAPNVVREFLNGFQRFGLIERRPKAGWLLKGFTPEFALELFEIREMFELHSARCFASLPETSPLWNQMEGLRQEHVDLLEEIGRRYRDFSDLDSRFHRLVNLASPNRFIDGFYDIITLIFHYHYQWNKRDEKQRNEIAVREHLTYIDALCSRRIEIAELACQAHLISARQTLIRSTSIS